jgi:hypothetical protein
MIGARTPPVVQDANVPVSKPGFETTLWLGTDSVTVAVCEVLGLVPLTVIVYVPPAAVALDTVIVDEPPAVTDDGLKLTVVPAGCPVAVRPTFSADPAVTLVEIVDAPLWPWSTVRLLGLAEIEKSFAGGGGGGGGGSVEQPGNLNEPIRVRQLKLPLTDRYSVVYQNVQSSLGSIRMEL